MIPVRPPPVHAAQSAALMMQQVWRLAILHQFILLACWRRVSSRPSLYRATGMLGLAALTITLYLTATTLSVRWVWAKL